MQNEVFLRHHGVTIMENSEMKSIDLSALADEIIAGRRLNAKDQGILQGLVDCDLEELKSGADRLRKHFSGDKVDLCTIISGVEGRCSENCKFCAQSAHHHTGCEAHAMLDEDAIVAAARANQEEGVDRFSIVDSGRTPTAADFEKLISAFDRMNRELDIHLCASLGFLSAEQLHRLHEAGVGAVHCNLETSRNYFPQICTTHTYDEKIENIKRAQAEGMEVCSGGIIGMGESWQDRIDMALTLAELHVNSIPINSLMPIKGTPLENMPRLTEEDILRTIAMYRYIVPEADIRLAGGRSLMSDNGRSTFDAGASASITGNMLTTSGSTIKQDLTMLTELGRDIKPAWA